MFIINGWNKLEWNVKIWWSKNAVLPLIAAALLIKWKVTMKNVPKIGDVLTFLDVLSWIGVKNTFENNILALDSTHLKEANFDLEKIKKIRASILMLPPLLSRLWAVEIPTPGGCKIGKRSVDSHLKWLHAIWYEYEETDEQISIKGDLKAWDITINAWFWVTPTENLIVANVLREWTTQIKSAAIEPHVMNVIDFLKKAWADIQIKYNHTIIIKWVKELKTELEFEVVSDYLQSGAYMIIAALCSKEYLTIENARTEDLYIFMEKMKEAWVEIEDLWNDKVKVYRAENLKPVSIQTNIFPWFPTDLQSPFAVLLTQAEWVSKIHEIMFESRLNFLVELEKMWGHPALVNPHQALIFWKTYLKWGQTVTSWDLRAWAAMVIAWLIAKWETKVTNIDYIKRGYESIVSVLQGLGADIEEID